LGSGTDIKQKFIPYWNWECYKSGMWLKVDKITESEMLGEAIKFTSDHILYGRAMSEVIFKWVNSMDNFLTNKSINRKAYLGHCAVFYKKQIPEYIVRKAWKHLSDNQRVLANLEAEKNINKWMLIQKKELMNTSQDGRADVTKMGYQMRLPFV
jgi:hypothetical protein